MRKQRNYFWIADQPKIIAAPCRNCVLRRCIVHRKVLGTETGKSQWRAEFTGWSSTKWRFRELVGRSGTSMAGESWQECYAVARANETLRRERKSCAPTIDARPF